MKHLNKFNKMNESGLSAYTDVWVIIKYGDTDINEIYLDKNEAELAAVKKNDESKQYTSIKNKWEVKTLDDAIWWIKEVVRDDEKYQNRSGY